ncbi:hypothetical protein CAL7716_107540 (plasmid) [Calothrix sp. PCC 7716]|nr:hypothetical protein CAL7716_107540 [Calothrix sp. PCC 7716]
MDDRFNTGAANGIQVIFSEAGFIENTHYFFSNGLLFMHEEYQEAMIDAIGEYMLKFPPPPEYLE